MIRKKDDETDLMIGRNIRSIREERCITITEMAKKLGVSGYQLRKYEHGINSVRPFIMLKICKVLNINVNRLFDINVRKDDLKRRIIVEHIKQVRELDSEVIAAFTTVARVFKKKGEINDKCHSKTK